MLVSFVQIKEIMLFVFDKNCGIWVVFDYIMSKWGVFVLLCFFDGICCWGELWWEVDGISEKMLVLMLCIFVDDGLVYWEFLLIVFLYVEYSLMLLGCDLMECMLLLMQWVVDYVDGMFEWF